MTILEKRKLAPERDEHLKKGEFTVLNGEYSKNFNVYVVAVSYTHLDVYKRQCLHIVRLLNLY